MHYSILVYLKNLPLMKKSKRENQNFIKKKKSKLKVNLFTSEPADKYLGPHIELKVKRLT